MDAQLKLFEEQIRNASSIGIFAHKNLDGDAMCSVLALMRLIELNYGKKALCLYDGNLPDALNKMPLRSRMKYYAYMDLSVPFDVAIVLDYGTVANLGALANVLERAKYTIEIDHHKNATPVANLCINDDTAAATAQIIYRMMCAGGWDYDMSVLELLMVAIITDTGFLKFVVDGEPLRIVADLVDKGVKIRPLMELMNNKQRKNVVTEARVVSRTEFLCHGQLALATVVHDDYKHLDGRGEIILNLLGQIKDVEYIVLLKEQKENQIGLSLRGRGKPVNHIAEMFGGGGHLCAAGAVVNDTLANVREKIVQIFKKEI